METVQESSLDIFRLPARITIAGASGSGKSFICSKLINFYKHKFRKIIVVGTKLENLDGQKVEYKTQYNPFEDDDMVENTNNDLQTLIVYDDVLLDTKCMKAAGETFMRGRHLNLSVVFICQNIYHADKMLRLITLNSTHIFLLRMRDINQVSCFGRSFLSSDSVKNFTLLYRKIVMKQQFSYILIDFTQAFDDVLTIRSHLFGSDFMRAYAI